MVGIGGRAWFERMVEPSEVTSPGDIQFSDRTDPGAGDAGSRGGSIGRRLMSATGRLLGLGEEEEVAPGAGQGAVSADGRFIKSEQDGPIAATRPASGGVAPAPASPTARETRAKPTPVRTVAARIEEMDVPDVDVASMVEVAVPVTYYMDDVLIPADIRRMGTDGMVIDALGAVPFTGRPTSMHVPFWLEKRYVTLRVRVVPCMDARVIGRVQRFVAAVVEIDDRHGVSMAQLLEAERIQPSKAAASPG